MTLIMQRVREGAGNVVDAWPFVFSATGGGSFQNALLSLPLPSLTGPPDGEAVRVLNHHAGKTATPFHSMLWVHFFGKHLSRASEMTGSAPDTGRREGICNLAEDHPQTQPLPKDAVQHSPDSKGPPCRRCWPQTQ